MIYFSELKNKSVLTEDNVRVGKLDDLIFLATENPNVTKLEIRDLSGTKITVPISFLKKINSNVYIKKDYSTKELEENELHVVKNILDKQIIDLQGNKIVRVNDIAIQDKDGFYIAGVDIGIFGLLRWFKLENTFNKLLAALKVRPTSQFLSWADIQPLELARGQVKLKKEETRLAKLRPEDLADYLEKTNVVNTKKILKILNEKFAAEVIGNLNINYQTSLFKNFQPEKAAKFLQFIDPDEAVDILLTLSEKKREQIITLFPEEKQKKLNHLLNLAKTPIGQLVTSEFLIVNSEITVREVIIKIKKDTADFTYLSAIYVSNSENQVIGVFSIHELLLQSLDTPVYKFMIQSLVVIHLTTPVEIAVKKMIKYKLASLPVIEANKQLLGIVTFDDAAEILLPKLS